MRNILIVAGVAVVAAGAWYFRPGEADTQAAPPANVSAGAAAGRSGGRGGGMTVDTGAAARHEIVDYITVVGNLVGEATVDVVPRVAGRLESISVRIGDRVTRGQQIAKVEDRELAEQVNQSDANLEVNRATVGARENDLKVAQSAFERAKTSLEHGLLSQQGLEDAEARYNSAASQVTVAKAQLQSTQARLDELKINLANTNILSPLDGVVGKRNLDPGAYAGTNTVILSVVDINTVRLVASLIEKEFKRISRGAQAVVEVDAFPGEQFTGQVSRVAPVFDPATRTASMEIEVPNPGYRLKPGMYARVRLTAERRPDALTVPRDAVVDVDKRHGVYVLDGQVARFRDVRTGIDDGTQVEVLDGLTEGTRVVTIGALAIRDGDRVQLTTGAARGGRGATGARGAGSGAGID
jgi:RND family efflux transporter MFP subunit